MFVVRVHVYRKHILEKNFECETCGMRFAARDGLNNHLVSHSNERNVICKYCGKGFKCKKTLYPHLKLHTVYCEFCNKGFAQRTNMKLHIRTHHKHELSLKQSKWISRNKFVFLFILSILPTYFAINILPSIIYIIYVSIVILLDIDNQKDIKIK